MFKFYTGQGRRFSIDAGPQLGYMIGAKFGDTSIYDWDTLNKFDVSLDVGVSYKFDGGFDIGFRMAAGMIPILEDTDYTHMVIQLGAGYRF